MYIRDSLDGAVANRLMAFRDLTKPSHMSRNGLSGESGCDGRRRFCACRHPCSDFLSVSPTAGTPSLDTKRVSSSTIPRRYSFDANPFADSITKAQSFTGNSLLNSLDLVVPNSPAGTRPSSLWTMKAWTPGQPILGHGTDQVIASPPLAFRRSDAYDAWLSSWCFRPTTVGAPTLSVPSIMVSSASQSNPFLPSYTSSPKIAPTQKKVLVPGGLKCLTPSIRLAARDSRVVSGMNKLQNLRELLAILDENMATNSRATRGNSSSEGKREAPPPKLQDAGFKQRLHLSAVPAGLAM